MSALLAGMQANIVRRTLNYQAPIEILAPDQVARPLREGDADDDRRAGPAALAAAALGRPVAEGPRGRSRRFPDVIGVTPIVSGPGFARARRRDQGR